MNNCFCLSSKLSRKIIDQAWVFRHWFLQQRLLNRIISFPNTSKSLLFNVSTISLILFFFFCRSYTNFQQYVFQILFSLVRLSTSIRFTRNGAPLSSFTFRKIFHFIKENFSHFLNRILAYSINALTSFWNYLFSNSDFIWASIIVF